MSRRLLGEVLEEAIGSKKNDGTYKSERVITSVQGSTVRLAGRPEPVLNLCANNYLGLAADPDVAGAAEGALRSHGFGLASVRFICGTQDMHKRLELEIADFLGTESSLLYTSCFDANGGLFENFLGADDAVISADLNHASIIDGIRLSKASRFRYRWDDLASLENNLKKAQGCRLRLVVTDGVFSMEGSLAPLDKIVPLCREYDALLAVDDSHATGFIGPNGRGTPEHFGVGDQVDIYTGTLGKALGGGCGGYIAGPGKLIDWQRNASRPYLFSNSLAPALVAGALKSIEIIRSERGAELRSRLGDNTVYFRRGMTERGFTIEEGIHPIVPIMIGDAALAGQMADDLLDRGIYVISFSFPVVPEGKARIRVQLSAVHTTGQLDMAMDAFRAAAREADLF
ncbi:glycine C-acetyltransferase [candidate division KSB1 bacterium]